MVLYTCWPLHRTVISLTLDAYYKNNDYSPLADNSYFVKSQRSGNVAKQCIFSQEEAYNFKINNRRGHLTVLISND